MLGLKENVLIGKLIPAGTGLSCYRSMSVESDNDPAELPADAEEAFMPKPAMTLDMDDAEDGLTDFSVDLTEEDAFDEASFLEVLGDAAEGDDAFAEEPLTENGAEDEENPQE